MHEADLSYLFTMQSLTSKPVKVLIGTFFGCCGSVVSLLLRLPDFEVLKDKSRTFLRAVGGTQPVIGGIFAFVLGALISAKIINISVGGSSDLILGFSSCSDFGWISARGSPETFCELLKVISVVRRVRRRSKSLNPVGQSPYATATPPPDDLRGRFALLSASWADDVKPEPVPFTVDVIVDRTRVQVTLLLKQGTAVTVAETKTTTELGAVP